MQKTLALLTALALAPAFTQAQATPQKTPAERADRQAQYLTRQLGLSAEQQPKVESILNAQLQEMQTLREKYPASSRQGAGAELKAAVAKYDAQLKAVLTPAQFSQYSQIRAERVEKVRSRRRG